MPGFACRRPPTAFSLDPSSRKTKRIEDRRHLDFIRQLPSIISGAYGCEACHIRSGSALHRKKHTGAGQRPDDSWTLPMTPAEHRAQHAMGDELKWWRQHEIDPFEVAIKLYEVTGDLSAGTAIIFRARNAL